MRRPSAPTASQVLSRGRGQAFGNIPIPFTGEIGQSVANRFRPKLSPKDYFEEDEDQRTWVGDVLRKNTPSEGDVKRVQNRIIHIVKKDLRNQAKAGTASLSVSTPRNATEFAEQERARLTGQQSPSQQPGDDDSFQVAGIDLSGLGLSDEAKRKIEEEAAAINADRNIAENFAFEAAQFIAGAPIAAKAVIHDIPREAIQGKADTAKALGTGIKEDFEYRYGPLAKGDIKRFGSRVEERPLSFGLDALAAYGAAGSGSKLAAQPFKKLPGKPGEVARFMGARSGFRGDGDPGKYVRPKRKVMTAADDAFDPETGAINPRAAVQVSEIDQPLRSYNPYTRLGQIGAGKVKSAVNRNLQSRANARLGRGDNLGVLKPFTNPSQYDRAIRPKVRKEWWAGTIETYGELSRQVNQLGNAINKATARAAAKQPLREGGKISKRQAHQQVTDALYVQMHHLNDVPGKSPRQAIGDWIAQASDETLELAEKHFRVKGRQRVQQRMLELPDDLISTDPRAWDNAFREAVHSSKRASFYSSKELVESGALPLSTVTRRQVAPWLAVHSKKRLPMHWSDEPVSFREWLDYVQTKNLDDMIPQEWIDEMPPAMRPKSHISYDDPALQVADDAVLTQLRDELRSVSDDLERVKELEGLETGFTPDDIARFPGQSPRAALEAAAARLEKDIAKRVDSQGGPVNPQNARPAAQQSAEQALPPVPEGHVRLYRGESSSGKSAPIEAERRGMSYTDDPEYARMYAEGGDIRHVDVPVADAEAAKLPTRLSPFRDRPDLAPSQSSAAEYLLSDELASRAGKLPPSQATRPATGMADELMDPDNPVAPSFRDPNTGEVAQFNPQGPAYVPHVPADRKAGGAIPAAVRTGSRPFTGRKYQPSRQSAISTANVETDVSKLIPGAVDDALRTAQSSRTAGRIMNDVAYDNPSTGNKVFRPGDNPAEVVPPDAKMIEVGSVQRLLGQGFENALAEGRFNLSGVSVRTARQFADDVGKAGKGSYVAVPKEAWDVLEALTKPRGQGGKLMDVWLNPWRRYLLALAPRWYINNFFGNTLLFGFANADDVGAMGRGLWRSLNPKWGKSAQDAVPSGIYAVEGMGGGKGLTHWLIRQNQKFENVMRRANYLALQDKHLKRAGIPGLGSKIKGGKNVRANPDEVLRVMGRMPEKFKRNLLTEFERTIGDYIKMTPLERNVVRRAAPFYSWFRVIGRVMATMPRDAPIRTRVATLVSQVANEEVNPLDPFMQLYEQGSLPAGKALPGVPDDWRLSTNALNPYTSLNEVALPLASGQFGQAIAGASQVIHPGGSAIIQQATGRGPFGQRLFGGPNVDQPQPFGKDRLVRSPGSEAFEQQPVRKDLSDQLLEALPLTSLFMPSARQQFVPDGASGPFDDASLYEMARASDSPVGSLIRTAVPFGRTKSNAELYWPDSEEDTRNRVPITPNEKLRQALGLTGVRFYRYRPENILSNYQEDLEEFTTEQGRTRNRILDSPLNTR